MKQRRSLSLKKRSSPCWHRTSESSIPTSASLPSLEPPRSKHPCPSSLTVSSLAPSAHHQATPTPGTSSSASPPPPPQSNVSLASAPAHTHSSNVEDTIANDHTDDRAALDNFTTQFSSDTAIDTCSTCSDSQVVTDPPSTPHVKLKEPSWESRQKEPFSWGSPQGKTNGIKKQTTLFSFMAMTPKGCKGKNKSFTKSEGVEMEKSQTNASTSAPLKSPVSVDCMESSSRTRTSNSTGPVDSMERNSRRTKSCPFYKKIPGTPFTVDAFRYGSIPNCNAYFLTHFHADHYMGLRKSFQHPIYCSKVTGNLVRQQLKVSEQYIHSLPLNKTVVIEKVEVTFLEANHCPGSVLILFTLPSGQNYLHTGDFRFCPLMLHCPSLIGRTIHQLYLDTTYCDARYDFPSQEEVIAFAVDKCLTAIQSCSRTLVVCGTYTIGKEKVFMALADVLGVKICVSRDKKSVLDCLELPALSSSLTTDFSKSCIHVLPMAKLNMRDLTAHLESWSESYSQLLAFKPTGWTQASGKGGVASDLSSILPYTRGPVSIYGIPYSEHSSYNELRRCVQGWRPLKILPTVNNHSADKRDEMQRTFQKWLADKDSKSLVQTRLRK